MKITQFLQISLLLTVLMMLQGCSSYSSHFGCGDAKGLNCRPLSIVDKQITNGQIEEIEGQASKNRRKSGKYGSCKGRFCRSKKVESFKPELKLDDAWHDFDELEKFEDFDGLVK